MFQICACACTVRGCVHAHVSAAEGSVHASMAEGSGLHLNTTERCVCLTMTRGCFHPRREL